jgi:hypothetical protein
MFAPVQVVSPVHQQGLSLPGPQELQTHKEQQRQMVELAWTNSTEALP